MLRYLHPNLESEFRRCHEGLRLVLYELDEWSTRQGIMDLVVTCVERSPTQNKAAGGVASSLHLRQPSRAVDVRCIHYASWEAEKVKEWLRARCPPPRFELVLTPHGTAPHYHIGLEAP